MTKYRVWWKPQIPCMSFYSEDIPTLEEARRLENTLAQYDLFQFQYRIKPDYCNMGGTQVWNEEEQEWEDV